ncbi:GntR family transcriptional regulator, partial [Streptomyces sp. TRM76130]|nr:GntR family transcriptional regulator [Streptomyces sp. TRM76130]
MLAIACAFAALRGRRRTDGGPETDHVALRGFLEEVRAAAGAGVTVHALAYGLPPEARDLLRQPDAVPPPRVRWHHAPGLAAWTDEVHRLLSTDAEPPRESAPAPHPLRDALMSWSTTWTPAAAPFTRVAAPRPSYDIPVICGSSNDSNAGEAHTIGLPAAPAASEVTLFDTPPGAPVTTEPVVDRLREVLLSGGHRPGDRVREAPLALGLGLSRRVVRAGLRALAAEGMLDLLPSGATA